MTNANLTVNSLAGWNFDDANLTGADLGGDTVSVATTFTGATWSNTTCPDFTNSNNDGDTCIHNGA